MPHEPGMFPLYDFKHPRPPQGATRISVTPDKAAAIQDDWWSQTGSNRRPPECKSGALPAELWPLFGKDLRMQRVGQGRLERPTSPLSGVRSNHLSYRPETSIAEAAGEATPDTSCPE